MKVKFLSQIVMTVLSASVLAAWGGASALAQIGSFHEFKSTFSEGRAWVEYYPTEDTSFNSCVNGLIDESGYVYLTTDNPGTAVSGGYTAVPREDGFDIYDTEGKNTFSFTETPELQMTVVGQGDGSFVIVEHSAGFAGNVYNLYLIDGTGQEISPRYEVGPIDKYDTIDPDEVEYTYLGSGVFACNRKFRYLNNGNLVDINGLRFKYSIYLETPFVDGISVAKKTETIVNGPFDTVCTITMDDLQSAETMASWFESSAGFGFYSDASISGEGYMLHRIDPWGWPGNDGAYGVYDYAGNRLAFMPSYPSSVTIMDMGAYKNGYAPLLFKGADQYYYVTMLNTDGEQLYEPVCLGKNPQAQMKFSGVKTKISDFAQYAAGNIFYDRFLFTGEDGFARIDPAGQITYFDQVPETSTLYAADENYVYFHDGGVTDHNGNIILDAVTFTEGPDNEPETASEETEKEYISVSDFRIEGKWKSTGDYGFGQAQPGAIVYFDGTHCNVLSPEDTYAFYKVGDEFILDCSGLLSGTESFAVKIVDEDNIDLYNGGYVTELSRVE